MYRLTAILIVFLSLAIAVVGCGKKEATPEGEITIPMAVSGEATTNLTTKAGTPVTAGESTQGSSLIEQGLPTAGPYSAPSVSDVQQALKNAGLYTGSVDGKSGPKTKAAVVEFQKQSGLTPDGKVGPRTWEKLKMHLNQEQTQ